MMVGYRFQHDQPRVGEVVHCFTTLDRFRQFARMMRSQDPDFHRMKFWEVAGHFVRPDEGDVEIRVASVKEIQI
jgi:hypothetical protein